MLTVKELREKYEYRKEGGKISMFKEIVLPKGSWIHTVIPVGATRVVTRVDKNGIEHMEVLDYCIEMVQVKICEIG